jgi:hypothetical protein
LRRTESKHEIQCAKLEKQRIAADAIIRAKREAREEAARAAVAAAKAKEDAADRAAARAAAATAIPLRIAVLIRGTVVSLGNVMSNESILSVMDKVNRAQRAGRPLWEHRVCVQLSYKGVAFAAGYKTLRYYGVPAAGAVLACVSRLLDP